MRRLVWLGGIFALLWAGWWFFAAQTISMHVEQWFEDRRVEGWQAETSDISVGGFPMALETRMTAPALADPQTGLAFSASELQLRAPVWRPGHVTMIFPQDDIVLASPLARHVINAQGAQADLRLRPGSALEVHELSLGSGPWHLVGPAGRVFEAKGLHLAMIQDADTDTLYRIDFDAPDFQLGNAPRKLLRVPETWPLTFDRLAMDMSVIFDKPFDMSTIEVARPQPRRLDLTFMEAVWGSLSFRGAAALDVSSEGLLSGEVSFQARNWREILGLAESAGILPAAMQPQVEAVFDALARGTGNPETLELEISISDGQMFIGFIPLGSAPRLILR